MDDPVAQFKQWYTKQPLVTRTYLTGAFILTILLSFQVVSPLQLFYTFDATFFNFDLWRPITSFLYQGKFSFGFLFAMFFCYFGLSRVEKQLFDKDTYADYLWLCISLYTTLLILASILPIYWIGDPFIFAMIYIWCKRRPFETIRLFFGFEVKSGYFPWIFMGFQVLMGGSLIGYLAGLFCGHLYITIKDIYLQRYHKDYLPTPQFFKRWIYKRNQVDNIRVENRRNQPFAGRPARLD